ncbi:MAG: hypothetical protein WCG87_11440, partial [Bacteroidota bacterium]
MLQSTVNNSNTYSIENKDGQWFINNTPANWDAQWQPNGLISILHNNKSFTAIVEKVDTKAKEVILRIDGQVYKVAIKESIDIKTKAFLTLFSG